LLTLSEYLLQLDLGIDELLFRGAQSSTAGAHPGRMAEATALGMAVFGIAILCLDSRLRGVRRLSRALALLGAMLGLLAIVGHIYNAKALYTFSTYSTVALHTAAMFLALGVGALCARPEYGVMAIFTSRHFGGSLARRVLPVTVPLTFLIGWLLIKGAREALYDTEFAVALFATTIVLIFAVVVWVNARLLNMADAERHQAELVVRNAEARKTAILESAIDCIITADRAGRIVEFNPAAEKTFGHRQEAIAGKELAETIIPPAFRERHRQGMSHYLSTGEGPVIGKVIEVTAMRGDGSEFPVELAINVIQLNGEPLFTAYLRDITERKRAEETVSASEARYKLLFDENPHPMWVYDIETLAFLAVNAAAVAHYGYSTDEFLSMTMREIRPPEDIPMLLEAVGALTPEATARVVRRHRKKDGTLIDVESSSRGIVIGGRSARLVLAVDITERKQLEDQLRQSQKMEAVGRLAGGIAHDFNNLLTAIIGYADLLLSRSGLEKKARNNIEEIRAAGDRAASLTRQLLAFSRKQMLQPRVLDLNAVVSNIQKMLHRLIGEDIELVTFAGSELGLVRADPGQIEQIILNLVVNARDAMPEGGKLTIETANVDLDETYAHSHSEVTPGAYVLLALSDTGAGMDSETCSHAFEPFFTTKELGRGTGLGLSTVYGIVKQSGGHVWVYSETGKGTTFKVYLPRVYEVAQTAEIDDSPAKSLEGSETILLVEDDDGVRTLATTVLERFGYRVLAAATGVEALEVSRLYNRAIELLVTDVVMPEMGGKEMASRLRQTRPDMGVLYCSGYTENAIVHHGVIDDEVAFLQKPFSPDGLARKVRDVLDALPRQSHSGDDS
jgi:PAS domain S-box-containing protein